MTPPPLPLSRFLCAVLLLGAAGPARAAAPDFHADIAPLLRQYCAGCHNDEDFAGDFSVERYADLAEGGSKGVMLRPGDPERSYLMRLMTGKTEEPMPPRDEPQPSPEEIALIARWIQEGAAGPEGEADLSILAMLTVPEIPAAPGQRAITAMERSPDGRLLAVARFAEVEVSGEGREPLKLQGIEGKVNALHFSAEGRLLVTASGIPGLKGTATIWDADTGEALRQFGEGYHRDALYDAELSPDGKVLATGGYDAKVALWDAASGEQLQRIEIHNGAIYDLAFSPDGAVLASASGDATVKLWRVSDGERLDTLNQPQGEQFSVAFSPEGDTLYAAGADSRIRAYRFISRQAPAINPLLHARFAHEGAVTRIVLSADGRWLASAGDDRAVKLWALPDLVQVQAWEDQPDVASALAFAGDAVVAGRMDGAMEEGQFDRKTLLARLERGAAPAAAEPVLAAPAREKEDAEMPRLDEAEAKAGVALPAEVSGAISAPGEADLFPFSAKAGERWILEAHAAREGSPLDSKVEVLHADGQPVERVRLQATRDSWFEFRGKDSRQSNDFRVFNWAEMELNEYLYCNGEVVMLWLYPRGPDSGFHVYPGFGDRHTYFGTTARSHALGGPCFIVRPLPPGEEAVPNGLPVFTVYQENDDDPSRRHGTDSVLDFTAPADGDYLARISDSRGFGGEGHAYRLEIRPPRPGFRVTHDIDPAKGLSLAPGSGREFVLKAERLDGFAGEIRVEVAGLPEGFSATSPVVIEAGQHQATGAIHAAPGAALPEEEAARRVTLVAAATVAGEERSEELASPGPLAMDEAPPKLRVEIQPDGESGRPARGEGGALELTIQPGQTITARVLAERLDFADRIEFGTDDAGRNLAHGLIIDNIGLNGLMIPEESSEQRFFITAAPWVPESTRTFHLRAKNAGGAATPPIILHVKAGPPALSARGESAP